MNLKFENPVKKVGNMFMGIIVGFIFIVIATILLWWNEGNNVKNIKTVEEAREALVNVSSDKVDSANEGKLVSTNGALTVEDPFLLDEMFNVKVEKTAVLDRIVEMYQYEETEETKDDKTVYTYKKVWDEDVIDSNHFENTTYVNPSAKPYDSSTFIANKATLGAFTLSEAQKNMLGTDTAVILADDIIIPEGYKKVNNMITNSADIANPQIGDVRITYKYNTDTTITVLAMQQGDSFVGYVSEQNKTVNRLESGIYTGEEMINFLENDNNIIKWVLRAVGIAFMIIGFVSFFNPISSMFSIIPFVGKHIQGFINGIGALIGAAVSMIVIAVAWIRFRPLVGLLLLGGVIGIIVIVLLLVSGKRKQAKNVAAVPQQPMQPMQQMPTQPMMQQPVQGQMTGQPMPVQQPVEPVQQAPVIEQNNVLAQMQDNYVTQSAQEEAEQVAVQESDPMSVFNQNINDLNNQNK